MYVPVPVMAVVGIAIMILVLIAWRRRGIDRDLMAPPPFGGPAPLPRAEPPQAWPAGAAPIGGALPDEIAGQVRALNAAGRKIEAIKLVRAATGLGLAEAKDLAERM